MSALRKGKRRGKAPSRKAMRKFDALKVAFRSLRGATAAYGGRVTFAVVAAYSFACAGETGSLWRGHL